MTFTGRRRRKSLVTEAYRTCTVGIVQLMFVEELSGERSLQDMHIGIVQLYVEMLASDRNLHDMRERIVQPFEEKLPVKGTYMTCSKGIIQLYVEKPVTGHSQIRNAGHAVSQLIYVASYR